MLWTKLRRDIQRQKGTFGAIVATLFIGVMVFTSTYSSYRNLDESYATTFDELGMADLTVSGGAIDTFAARAMGVPGVGDVATRIVADVPIRVDGDATLLGRVVGMPLDDQPEVNRIGVLAGTYLRSDEPDGVVVEQHMTEEWGLRPGAELELLGTDGWRTVSVVGDALSAEYLWPTRSRQDTMPLPEDYGVLFVPEDVVAGLTGSSAPTDAVVTFDVGVDTAATASRLGQIAVDVGAGTAGVVTQADQPSNAFLRTDIEAFGTISKVFPMVFLVAAAIAAYVLLTRRVHAERPVIGTLLAHGVRRRAIVVHYLSFGLLAGLLGALPGAIVGASLAGVITGAYAGFMKLDSVVKDVYPEAIMAGLLFGLLTGAVAAAIPGLLASRITPADAMRSVAPSGRGRPSVPERIIPGFRRLPVGGRMVLRNLERNRRRALFTATGVGMALSLVIVAWGAIDSMSTWIDRHFNQVATQDARVSYDGTSPTYRDLSAIVDIDGVEAAEQTYHVPASFRGPDGRYDTFLVGLAPDTTMHGFRRHAGEAWPPTDGVVVGRAMLDETGANVGDVLLATFPGTDREVELRISGFVDEPMGTMVYLPLDGFVGVVGPELMQIPAMSSTLVAYEDGLDRATIGDRIGRLPGVAAVEDSRALYDLVDGWMGMMHAFAAVMLAFGCLMASALIFVMMTVNMAERADEMATLQSIGVSHRRTSRLLMAENVVMALVGIGPGLVAGSLMVDLVMSAYINDMWRFEGIVLPPTMVVSAVGIVLVAVLSQGPSLRALRRLNLAGIVSVRGH